MSLTESTMLALASTAPRFWYLRFW